MRHKLQIRVTGTSQSSVCTNAKWSKYLVQRLVVVEQGESFISQCREYFHSRLRFLNKEKKNTDFQACLNFMTRIKTTENVKLTDNFVL